MTYIRKKNGSKQELAYLHIKQAIINNEFEPNSMLIEGELCATLGISKTPVREALKRLVSEKYVEYIPEKGTFVSRMGLEDLIELYDVRQALEGMAARRCAQRRDNNLIEQLEEVLCRINVDLIDGKNKENVREDLEFHEIVIRGSKNAKLISYSSDLMDQINRFASTTVHDIERLQLSYEEHKKILNAIINADGDLAEQAIRVHIESVKEYQIRKHYIY